MIEKHMTKKRFSFALGLCAALCAPPCQARVYLVDNGNPAASDAGPGDAAHPCKTINAAAQKAGPGDEVLVRPGIYRETVVPARGGEEGKPIIYRAETTGKVLVKGTDPWQPTWAPVEGQPHIFRAPLPATLLEKYNPFRCVANTFEGEKVWGELFLNGAPLPDRSAGEILTNAALAWRMADAGTPNAGRAIEIYAPNGPPRELEITTRASLFRPDTRGLGYIEVHGFRFEECATPSGHAFWREPNPPQAGALSTRSGHHWVIEDNVVRFASGMGLDCGREGLNRTLDGQPPPLYVGHHLIRGNIVSDNGLCGIAGSGQMDTRIENNIVERNNRRHFFALEEAGIKCHYFLNGVIEGNLVRDNEAEGIWLDNVWQGTTVQRNACIGNRTAGIFLEMGRGPCLVQNNIIGWTRPGFHQKTPRGDGFYAHDASGFIVRNNLIVHNTSFGVHLRTVAIRAYPIFPARMESFAQAPLRRETVGTSDITVEGNLVAGNRGGLINVRFDAEARNNRSNGNYFTPPAGTEPRFQLNTFGRAAPTAPPDKMGVPLTLPEWRQITGNDVTSKTISARATLTDAARPHISIEVGSGVPADFFPNAADKSLPFQLEITAP